MKKYTLFCLLCSLVFAFQLKAQTEIQWSEAIELSSSGNSSAVVDVLGNGSPIAVWGQGSSIFFSKMENENWATPIQLSTGNQNPSIYSFGGLSMAAKGNTIYIVFENFINGVFLIRSLDGGASFTTPVNVYDPVPGKWTTLPSVDIDDNGNPLISVILENTNETEGVYIMMHSTDQGQTFSAPAIANAPANGEYVCECCPSTIYSKDENIWLIFRNNDNNLRDIWVTKSTDNGLSFNQGLDVDDTNWVLNACPISGPKLAPLAQDSLITAWVSAAQGGSRLYISTLNGQTMQKGYEWTVPRTNDNSIQRNPAIAGHQDTIAMVWEESGFGDNAIDLLFSFSINGTTDLFSNFTNITEAPGTQARPSLAYDKDVLHLIYASSGGVLLYKKGELSPLSNLNHISETVPSFELLQQPLSQNSIKLKYRSLDAAISFDAFLYNVSGQLIQGWKNINMNPDENTALQLSSSAPGSYWFLIQSGHGNWSSPIIISE